MKSHKHNHSWSSYYSNHKTPLSNILLHWQYLLRILSFGPKTLMEIGCGPADHSLFIKSKLPRTKIYLVDQDKDLLEKIKQKHGRKIAKMYTLDILNKKMIKDLKIPFVDVIISQGLMEHFDDKEFVKIIENFRNYTKKMIFSVPSEQYPTKDFGNEVLRSKNDIEKLLKNVDRIRSDVSYYIDIGVRTKILGVRSKKKLMDKIRYLILGSNQILVEITYLNRK